MIRAFVAIPAPLEIKPALIAAQTGLRTGRLVPSHNFHITLAFLGDQPDSAIEAIHDALSEIRHGEIDLALDGLGMFGRGKPRAIHAGIEPTPEIAALRAKVRRAARRAGIELASRRFVPHITLARFGKGMTRAALAELQAHVARRMGDVRAGFRADTFVLCRSELGGEHPFYETLAEYPLEADAA